jgi:hypothetical protein
MHHHTKRARATALLAMGLALAGTARSAGDGCEGLEEVVGFTLVAATRVQGQFDGCAYDRLVAFENGLTLRCSQNLSTHAQQPRAYVFLRQLPVGDDALALVKVCIAGEMYTMRKP